MKNFSLGVLVMLCLGLMIQNNHLHNQLRVASRTTNSIAPRVAKQAIKPQVVQANPVVAQVQPQKYYLDGKPMYNEGHDPRCPSHLPYYDGHWGCVVKRP